MLSLTSIERHVAFDDLADAVLDEAGRRGALLAFLVVSTFRSMTMLSRGDLGGAEAEAREALRSAAEQGWERGAAGLAAIRATALLDLGDLSGAGDALADAELMSVAPGFPTALVLSARGRLAAEQGDVRAGIDALLECGQTLDAMRIHSPGVLPWRSDAAILLSVAGDSVRARELADEEVRLARRLAGPVAVGRALHAAARATRGDERIALLEEAAELLAGSPAGLARAMVAVELGATLRRHKRPADARRYLNEGLDDAARCRCVPLASRARDELAVLGVAPRKPIAFGPSALTPSEVRVARLAAEGRTNNDIAQQLFVTRKTVEKHLASAYRKLGIDSRAQLDAASFEQPQPAG
jgi:DNA-binding NarL/FixJ family response regulator